MATVRLSFSPYPAHVRTARLVGVAVARRAGVADATLDEVRLAIGEACSRAVALHRRHALNDLILVELKDDDHFTVRVTDRAPADTVDEAPAAARRKPSPRPHPDAPDPFAADTGEVTALDVFGRTEDEIGALTAPTSALPVERRDIDALSEEAVAEGMGLTLLAGLVEDLSVRPAQVGAGTEVEMSWPTGTHR
jgi:anti-sigma regulatory factor (Ser/Thr protein kinase)